MQTFAKTIEFLNMKIAACHSLLDNPDLSENERTKIESRLAAFSQVKQFIGAE